MAGFVLDASFERHGWPAVRAAGFTGVSLYLSNDPKKNCKPADVAGVQAVGLDLMLNWESTTGRPAQGAPAGTQDAQRANAQADALGYPDHCAIYFSCDQNATASGSVLAYYAAAKSASKRPVGAYGGADLVIHLLWSKIVDYAWVANAGSWDHGFADVGAHLHQHYHTRNVLKTPIGWPLNSYDESAVLQVNYGQWRSGILALMALTDKQQDDLFSMTSKLFALFFGGQGGGPAQNVSMIHDIESLERQSINATKTLGGTLTAAIAAIPTAQAAVVDPAALAEAVADELHRRLEA